MAMNAGLKKWIAAHKKGASKKSAKGGKASAKTSGKAYWAKVKKQGHR